MRHPWVVVCVAVLVVGEFFTGRVAAGEKPESKGSNVARPVLPAFTSEREAAALQFVAEHHAELGAVLGSLKTLDREQYEQAIRELAQTMERLAMLQAKDPVLYELSLEGWKINSRIEVLAAHLASAKAKDPELEAELKDLLYRQIDLQREQVEHNRKRLLESLEGMETNIKWLRDNREQLAQRRFQNLIQVRQKMASKRKPDAAEASLPESREK
jgi:hypothetical protein